jgi:copper homeostasis protein
MYLKPKYLLEICCYSPTDVINAEKGGAHRVELCNGYEVGGTTPSLACIQLSKSLSKLPVYVMIRPRGGNFIYSDMEKKTMLQDATNAIQNKADGIVFGALTLNGNIDLEFCRSMKNLCGNIPITFHRAIDLMINPLEAILALAEIGISTVLTSGGANSAIEGVNTINAMHQKAPQHLKIMAGAGVNAGNILEFAKIGITHFHSSASEINGIPNGNDKLAFNALLKNNQLSQVAVHKVEAMKDKLNNYFL